MALKVWNPQCLSLVLQEYWLYVIVKVALTKYNCDTDVNQWYSAWHSW